MSTEDAVGLARLVLGEESSDATQMTSDHHDALREMLNQMFGSASSQLKVFFNKPVTLSFAELRLVESAENWTPHAAAVAMGHLTVDGVPHARLAVTIPSTILDEAAIALRGDEKEEIDGSGLPPGLEMILDIEMPVTVELGRTRMPIKEILALGPGSIIELDKLAGEPVDLLVNERAIAKGEVVVIDENFGLRLTQISHAAERIRSLS
ncbi:MAG: flagellar motor switch protein FliN [Candidatus Rokubacteria bacterium]|nr:flagellar motor switch protein FliN [Candidatus Rokubacteria bacterium]